MSYPARAEGLVNMISNFGGKLFRKISVENLYSVKIIIMIINKQLLLQVTILDIDYLRLYVKMQFFFLAAVVSILLYGYTTWTLTKRMEKKINGNYTRMPQVILNKSWRQHPTKQQLYDHLPPITKTIRVGLIGHAGHC